MSTPTPAHPGARKKPIKRGDYFLKPYRGKRIDLLVRADGETICGQNYYYDVTGFRAFGTLQSCHRCSPSLANRILGKRTIKLPRK